MNNQNPEDKVVKESAINPIRIVEDNISDVICVHDPNGCYRSITRSVVAILGYSPEELIGTSPYCYFHPDDIERIRKDSHNRALSGESSDTRIEYRFRKKDNSYVWLETQTTPMFDSFGYVTQLLTVSRDISERKKAELILTESASMNRHLFMTSPAVKLLVNPVTGQIVDANQSAENYYGYTMQELQSMSIFEINMEDQDVIKRYMERVCKEYLSELPFRHKIKDGSLRDVEVYSSPLRIGDQVLLHSIVIDVTDRKNAEAELRESRERLSLVVEGAKAGIWDWDMQSDRVYYDKQWKAILGYEEEEISDNTDMWICRWHPDDAESIRSAMDSYMSGKSDKYEIQHRLQHKDGTYRWILTTGKLTHDLEGRPIRWTGCNIDITQQKRIEELYLESMERLREFANAVPDVSFIVDEDGNYVEVFGDEELLHIPKGQFIGKATHQVLQKDDADFILDEVRQVIAAGKQRAGLREFQFGQVKRYFSGRTVPLSYTAKGKRTAAVIAADITEQVRTEKLLQKTYELRRRSDFINDILAGKMDKEDNLAYLSSKLGLDLRQPIFACLLLSSHFEYGRRELNPENTANVQKLKETIIDALSRVPNSIAWDCREGIGVLCLESIDADVSKPSAIIGLIREKLLECKPTLSISIGIGDSLIGIKGLKKSCQQALRAAIAASCKVEVGISSVHFRESGILQLIPDPFGGEEVKECIQRNIGKLIDYDKIKQSNYLATLEDTLRGLSVREIANKLYVHPKTIVFRQKRIEKILGVELYRYETRLILAIALQLYKINHRSEKDTFKG